jgi:hypothetical protein
VEGYRRWVMCVESPVVWSWLTLDSLTSPITRLVAASCGRKFASDRRNTLIIGVSMCISKHKHANDHDGIITRFACINLSVSLSFTSSLDTDMIGVALTRDSLTDPVTMSPKNLEKMSSAEMSQTCRQHFLSM